MLGARSNRSNDGCTMHVPCTPFVQTTIFRHARVSSTYPCMSVRWLVGNNFGFPICQRLWSPYVKSWRERTPIIFVYFPKVYFLKVYFLKVYFLKVYFPRVYFLKVYFPKVYFLEVYFTKLYFLKVYFSKVYFFKCFFRKLFDPKLTQPKHFFKPSVHGQVRVFRAFASLFDLKPTPYCAFSFFKCL